MALSGKNRLGVSQEYGSARASDIARFGVGKKRIESDGGKGFPEAEQGTEASVCDIEYSDDWGVGARNEDVIPRALPFEQETGEEAQMPTQERRDGDKDIDVKRGSRVCDHVGTASHLPLELTDTLATEDTRALRRKVVSSVIVLLALVIPSLGIYGASTFVAAGQYVMYNPIDVVGTLAEHVYNLVGSATHMFAPNTIDYGIEPFYKPLYDVDGHTPMMGLGEDAASGLVNAGWDLYHGVIERFSVIGITLICAVLLAISGMLYQNVFKNPIAGPGMLGVSSGVSLGMMLLVYLFGIDAFSMLVPRYAVCYGFGAAILVFVILAGRKLSGKGQPFDIVTMLLVGSILSQLIGFVVTYVTLFVMDPDVYQQYITLSQMLVVDTSGISWMVLLVASAVSLAPVVYLRFRFNALAFDEQEVRMLGINFTALRAVALICGAIMILAAQIHIGAVAMVSLIVPFLSRSWFGCEFRKQLVGNICISTVLLLVCRDIVDLIPFVGDGIGIGSAVSVVALPIFLLIMARHMRGWE